MKFMVRVSGTDWVYDTFVRPSAVSRFFAGRSDDLNDWIVEAVFDDNDDMSVVEQTGMDWMKMGIAAQEWTKKIEKDFAKVKKQSAERKSYRRRKRLHLISKQKKLL